MVSKRLIVTGLVAASLLTMVAGATRSAGRVPAQGSILGAGLGLTDEPNRPIANFVRQSVRKLVALRTELGVTEEQRAEIKAVVQAHREELVPAIKAAITRRQALREAVLADSPDEQSIRTAADELGKAVGDAAVIASRIAGEVKPILTQEQKTMLQQFHDDRQNALSALLDEQLPE